ncbi:hypothetical protein AB4Y45_44625 [Paraburkholderia sp. EG287A]|uniref:hypothetical protein n=1 Tax=unclassified Paraburkholderia TaxID=2615204 RepID=UPI0034D1C6B0
MSIVARRAKLKSGDVQLESFGSPTIFGVRRSFGRIDLVHGFACFPCAEMSII